MYGHSIRRSRRVAARCPTKGAPRITRLATLRAPVLIAFLVSIVLGHAGCAARSSARPSAPAVSFPSRVEVAHVPSSEVSPALFGAESVRVDEWTFESPPSYDVDPDSDDRSSWSALVREAAVPRAGEVRLASALGCAAAEMARFHVRHHGLPTEDLRRFMIARCGGDAPTVSAAVWFGTFPTSMSEAEIAKALEEEVRPTLARQVVSGSHEVGMAAFRDGEQLAAVLLVADSDTRIEGGSRRADSEGRVVVRGTVRGDVSGVLAKVNQGRYGVAPCEVDAQVNLPSFALTCRVLGSDAFARLQVLVRRTSSPVLSNVADMFVYGRPPRAVEYHRQRLVESAQVGSAAELTAALVDRLNRVRREAEVAPITLSPRQSAENARVAGALLAASAVDGEMADRVAAGLLAGWDVDGLIRRGDCFVGVVNGTRDASRWLEVALESPMGRQVLMSPLARRIAVGPTLAEGKNAIGAVVTTYELFESNDHASDADRVADRLAAARRAAGVDRPVRLSGPVALPLAKQVSLVSTDEKPPASALSAATHAIALEGGRGAAAYMFETNELDEVTFPPALLAPGRIRVAVAVGHHRARGAAWGQYIVIVAALPPSR